MYPTATMSPGPLNANNLRQREPCMGTDTVAYASGNECALLFVRQAVDVFGRGVIMVRRQWFDMRAW